MESRIKSRVLSIIIAGAMIASIGTTWAATTKPTPKPTVKATKKPVAKKTVARKPTPKKRATVYKRKVVKVLPSPSPAWPPIGFTKGVGTNNEIYYRVPTNKELASLASADTLLTSQLKYCLPSKSACGVVRVVSVNGCTWWELNSTVRGPLSATDNSIVPYGTLRTTAKGTKAKQVITVLLISTEPLKPNVTVAGINISCHHDPITEKIPLNVYTLNTPIPTDTPTINTN